MANMKKLCVLEQSGTIHDPYTSKKRQAFQTKYSDFYRLNWKHKHDPEADLFAPGVLWSEGRSLLYDFVPKTYEYYMFMDDDIYFEHETEKPLDEVILSLLEEYEPISASFYCENIWGRNLVTDTMRRQRRAYPFVALDLQLAIYSREFAEVIFPVPFHGSDMCMWYAWWIANKINPGKQICFSEIVITNMRSEPHFNQSVRKYKKALVKLFSDLTLDNTFVSWEPDLLNELNKRLFYFQPVKEKFLINKDMLKQLYDTDSIYIKNRSPVRNKFHQEFIQPQLDALQL